MDNKKIGDFIKKLRLEKKLTQQQLADLLYIERTTLNKWEKGVICITSTNLKLLSRIFNITTDELLEGKRIKNKYNGIKLNKFFSQYKIITFIITSTLIFNVYIFCIYEYNSIYNISESNDIYNISGTIIKTNSFIHINVDLNVDLYDEANLYYIKDGIKKYIINAKSEENIIINNYNNTEPFFENDDFEYLTKNMYIEIRENNNITDIKLNILKN